MKAYDVIKTDFLKKRVKKRWDMFVQMLTFCTRPASV